MTVKSEVQGIVQALFGAYAGGYLAELTAEATANGTGAVAARLASVQGIILGKDLSANATFINTMLGNLGVGSLNPAYAAASKWATDALAGGASRADLVTSAVAFLDGIAAGTIVDAAYSDIAKAYAAKVAAGVTYSETAAGSKVLSVTALQTAAGATTPADVGGVLAEQTAAKTAVTSFLAALDLNKDGTADGLATGYVEATQSLAVKGGEQAAEAAVQILLGSSAVFAGVATYDAGVGAEGATAATVAANNVLEDAAAALIQAQVANARVVKTSQLTIAANALGADATTRAANKATIDALLAADTALTAANAAATNADIKAEAALDTWAANTSTSTLLVTTANAAQGGDVVFTAGQTPKVEVVYSVGGTATTATYTLSGGWTYSVVTQGVLLSAEVKAAAEAVFATSLAAINANDIQIARASAVTALNYQNTEDVNYILASTILSDHDKGVTALNKALENVTAARKLGADLTVLETAVTTASAKLTAAGYVTADLVNGDARLGTTKSDLFTVAGLKSTASPLVANTASITGFGAAGDDALIVTGWSKAATAKGDNNVLEYFVTQVGANTVITFENKAFGLSDAGTVEATVTLVGVDSTTLSFADGLIVG